MLITRQSGRVTKELILLSQSGVVGGKVYVHVLGRLYTVPPSTRERVAAAAAMRSGEFVPRDGLSRADGEHTSAPLEPPLPSRWPTAPLITSRPGGSRSPHCAPSTLN